MKAALKKWGDLCRGFAPELLANILRIAAPSFRLARASLDSFIKEDGLDTADQIGVIELSDSQTVIVSVVKVKGELTARSGKRKQYDLARRVLRHDHHNAGIFAFYDNGGRFRFSLVTATYYGTQRQYSTFKRYTFFIDPELPNKTFLQQMKDANFSEMSGILETFSLEAVSDEFYKDFKNSFDILATAVQGTKKGGLKEDVALLFAVRIIFLGFVQKKGWLGDNPQFLQDFWLEYRQSGNVDTFYKEWLEPLFFEALNSPPGRKVAYGHEPFSKETQKVLQMAPYLNGELFKRKQGVDNHGLWIPDEPIGGFFDFLFQYNFTVEENELYDEDLELNPEFLGIIFERITNKDQGAVYTPRMEVDLMCRLALVKWLQQTTNIDKKDLYRLFFREAGTEEVYDEYQKQGDFSQNEIRVLIERLENVTVCDPAAGSGAFEVGMLQVLEQVLENLYSRNNTPKDLKTGDLSPFKRKKAIIARSLYGVEVKRWAVWINHLRLWLTLFVDMPDDRKGSFEPLLPNLSFKVRTGDSLIQRIGSKTFPVWGHANLSADIKRKITLLKEKKRDFFYNRNTNHRLIEQEELAVFRAVLDEEIMEHQKRIRDLNRPDGEQLALFEKDYEQIGFDFTEKIKAECANLKAEIDELQAQKQSLKDERPFVWSIEFAEIFFERGGFDIIIGNPPYLRQEEISDPNNKIVEPQAYKDALFEMLRFDFPDYFAKSKADLGSFKKARKPSGRSDLYTYFYIRSLRLLNTQGIHIFICSNSWLDVGYGTWLQEFFLRQAPLHLVIDNHARRSFARADVNTVITVAGAPKQVNLEHVTRFVAFKQPFEDVVLSDNLLDIEEATTNLRDERFRVFPITAGELLWGGSEADQDLANQVSDRNINQLGKYLGDKWGGKYLRAPDIFFTILEKGKDKLVRLGDIAKVRFGIKTGANDFFYLEPLGAGSRPDLVRVRNGAGWEGELEEQFLKPVIKSPRECRSIMIKPEDLKYRIFMCHKDKAELKGAMVLKYIQWGEQQGYHQRPSTHSRRIWWDLGDKKSPKGIIPCSFRKVFTAYINSPAIYTDKRLYEHNGNKPITLQLNSILFPLFLEIQSRSYGGGGGPIDATVEEMNAIFILEKLTFPNSITEIYPLRQNKDIFTECGINPESEIPISEQEPNPLPDRKALDDMVFDALGLTGEERKEVYRAVCQLVWERISKARSV